MLHGRVFYNFYLSLYESRNIKGFLTGKEQKKRVKRRNEAISTVEELVIFNTGMDRATLLSDTHEYKFPALKGAAELILKWKEEGRNFFIAADYDVDGITSGESMRMLLISLGISEEEIVVRYPRRFTEGYGLSAKVVEEEFDDGGAVITVDNGITAFDAIIKAKQKAMGVLVTDHHLPLVNDDGQRLYPDADYCVDPKAIDDQAEFTEYCGCGIVLKLAEYMLSDRPSEDKALARIRAMAAIATVADCVPLIGESRRIVNEGLPLLTRVDLMTTGVSALQSECYIDKHVTAKDVSFRSAPTLNAPGRLEDDGASKSAWLLRYNGDAEEALRLARAQTQANAQRKALQALWDEIADKQVIPGSNHIILYLPGCPEGVVGIVAGRLAQRHYVPTIILTDSSTPGILKGSGRSVEGVHLKEILDQCKDTLAGYGGHAAAAGVKVSDLEGFKTAFANALGGWQPQEEEVYYDLEITADDVERMSKEVALFEPYGVGNPAPIFLIRNVDLTPRGGDYYQEIKSGGVKLFGNDFSATAFGDAARKFLIDKPRRVDLIGTIEQNYFGAKCTVEVHFTEVIAVEKDVKKTPLQTMLEEKATEKR
jgi:single-stranded-DNA-specific exonuclease